MSKLAAEAWSKHARIQNMWGSTEALNTSFLEAENEDAEYIFMDTDNASVEFRQLEISDSSDTLSSSEEGIREMIFTLRPDNAHVATWHALQGITLDTHKPPYPEFATGDLWVPHPDPAKARYAWRFVGRKDDLVQFSTGNNLHPGPMESAVSSQKPVSGVLMLGSKHQQVLAALLTFAPSEPTDDHS